MKTLMRYTPLTATPFKSDAAYNEIEPCRTLQPYVRCFWGGEYACPDAGAPEAPEIVIPDTCADIIYRMDDAGHMLTSNFAGINDRSFLAHANKRPDIESPYSPSASMPGAPTSSQRIPLPGQQTGSTMSGKDMPGWTKSCAEACPSLGP